MGLAEAMGGGLGMLGYHDESGASAVEFALVLPLLLILVFGTITGGMLYNEQLTLTQAAREGARFGATFPTDAAWEGAVVARIEQVSGGLLDSSNPAHRIEVTTPDADDGQFSVFVQRPGSLQIIVRSWELDLSSRAVARHETVGAN
jgi:Flp pilus assembly protein TadG